MSTTTHQGAEGAETMTAAIAWLEKRLKAARSDSEAHPEGHSNRTFYEAQAIAYENVLSLLEDGKAATPAPRTDGGMTAGEDVKRFAHAVLHGDDEHRSWLTEAAECFVAGRPLPEPRGKGTQATPAQPAGAVPDGLRALSEGDEAVFACACARWVRTLLASHPAGQSAGLGADIDQKSAWARAAETVGTEKPWWWDKPWAELSYGSQGDVQAWFQNRDPLHRVVEPDGPDRYVRRYCDPRPHMLAPAPDSTRTGDEATERLTDAMYRVAEGWVRGATRDRFLGGLRALSPEAAASINALAARPAAPEAQGAWQDISTVPTDGRTIIAFGGRFDEPTPTQADGNWWNSTQGTTMASRPTHWQPMPAPPASSGQGGR